MGAVKLATDIAKYYGVRPTRWTELGRWVKFRRASTLETRYPWWAFPAAPEVLRRLPSHANVFEFGGGGSTLWLLDHHARVKVVEHDAAWAAALSDHANGNLTVVLREPTTLGSIRSADFSDRYFDTYVGEVSVAEPNSYDLVIVDGRARVSCGLAARPHVKPGGMLLLDDSDRERYRELCEALADWKRFDFRGLKIGADVVVQTSIWVRPQ